MNLFKLSWKNIVYRPLSSGLSILLLASGLSIILISLITYTQLNDKFDSNANKVDLVVGAKGSRLQLVLCNIFQIDKPTGNINYARTGFLRMHPYVEKAIPVSLGDNYKSYRIVATSKDYIDLYNGKLAEGELWDTPMEVVAGSAVAKKLGLKIGDKFSGGHGIGESLHVHEETQYKVVGILERSNTVLDNLLITDLASTWIVHAGHDEDSHGFDVKTKEQHDLELEQDSLNQGETHDHEEGVTEIHEEHAAEEHHDHDHGHNHNVIVNYDSILKTIDPRTREITSVLVKYKTTKGRFTIPGIANNTEGMMAAEPAIELTQLRDLISPIIGVMQFIAILIMGIATISMFISMFNSLKDRKYEIALMRVLGASSGKVFVAVILEGVLLAVLGYVAAILISHISVSLVSDYIAETYHYDITGLVWLPIEWGFLGLAIIIGIISALYPAYVAYKTDISKTLMK